MTNFNIKDIRKKILVKYNNMVVVILAIMIKHPFLKIDSEIY